MAILHVEDRVAFVSGGGTELRRVAAIGRPVIEKPFELADLVRLAAQWEGAAFIAPAPGP